MQQLVAAALGLDPKRGDTIVVSSSGFDTGAQTAPAEKSSGMLGGKSLSTIVAALMLLLITVLLARSARRPKVKPNSSCPSCCRPCPTTARRRPRRCPTAERARAARRCGVPGQRAGGHDNGATEVDLLQAVENQPDDVAHLLRGWLAESRRTRR